MRKILSLLALAIAFAACTREEDVLNEPALSTLRVKNDTPYRFDNVYIRIGESGNTFGRLDQDQTSAYKGFNDTGYPYIRITIAGQDREFQIQPFDAAPAGAGGGDTVSTPLTCVITVNPANNDLTLYFVE